MDPTFAPGRQNWNFMNLFGTTITGGCALAAKSTILVDTTLNGVSAQATLNPEPHRVERIDDGQQEFALYDVRRLLQEHGHVNVHANYVKDHVYWKIKPPPITINRYLQGE